MRDPGYSGAGDYRAYTSILGDVSGVIEAARRSVAQSVGRGFSLANLSQVKEHYLLWPPERIRQTLSEESRIRPTPKERRAIFQTSPGESSTGPTESHINDPREHWVRNGENPPVGLILCAQKDQTVTHYAMHGLPNKVMAAEYRTAPPDEESLAAEITRTRDLLAARHRHEATSIARRKPASRRGRTRE